eukprot:TRINITY_DN13361_c0_g1_i3.p2 TRINITY_DN13361_c0_g1~~TRINITY_DN13361_c0_g1_i3.p2  ORF type:complete len:115 (+),score=6.93 TRINITY_DN13361_c0_g1_i3:184-528(+)
MEVAAFAFSSSLFNLGACLIISKLDILFLISPSVCKFGIAFTSSGIIVNSFTSYMMDVKYKVEFSCRDEGVRCKNLREHFVVYPIPSKINNLCLLTLLLKYGNFFATSHFLQFQ